MIRAHLENIELLGEVVLPITDGRSLRFSEEAGWIQADMQIEVAHREAESDLPTDVLQTTFDVADSNGKVWRVQTKTTAEYLIRKMVDLSFVKSHLCPFADADEDAKALFEKDFLADVRFSSDDRFYRQVVIGDALRSFQFKYTTVHLDLAFTKDESDLGIIDLVVRVREESFFDGESAEDLGSFIYTIDWQGLLRANTAVFSPEYNAWRDSVLPLPFMFSETGIQGEPNEGVTVV